MINELSVDLLPDTTEVVHNMFVCYTSCCLYTIMQFVLIESYLSAAVMSV